MKYPENFTADSLLTEILDLKLQKLALLTRTGKLPGLQSPKRASWNQLSEHIDMLMDQWERVDRAERLARNKT